MTDTDRQADTAELMQKFVRYGKILQGQRIRGENPIVELWDIKLTVDDFRELAETIESLTRPAEGDMVMPDDDEPKTWKELAEAAIADLRRYAHDEGPERRLVSANAYEERAAMLAAAPPAKAVEDLLVWKMDDYGEPKQALYISGLYIGGILQLKTLRDDPAKDKWRGWVHEDSDGKIFEWFDTADEARQAVYNAALMALRPTPQEDGK